MSYSDLNLLTELREMVGKPSKDEVSDRRLRTYLTKGLEWLAGELKYNITTDASSITLVAGTQEYAVPDDLMTVLWVEWNTNRLDPGNTFQWTRDGWDWRDTDGDPTQYAIEGRKLILFPVPDADTISTSAVLTVRYVAATPGLSSTGTGTPGLSDADQTLVQFYAAALYCASRPDDKANLARAQAFNQQVTVLLPRAKQRHQNAIEDFQPEARVWTRRTGAAR